MAIVLESTSTATSGSTTSIIITKPTGLAVGDWMVAVLVHNNTGSPSIDINTLAGWTLLYVSSPGDLRVNIQYKVADSGDVAASNFTWSESGGDTFGHTSSIYRLSGVASLNANSANDGGQNVTNDDTPSYSNEVTPAANSFLLMVGGAGGISMVSQSVSGYAITTSNPSWTEAVDSFIDSGSDDLVSFGAWANRPEATDTGNSSLTFGTSTGDTVDGSCILMAFTPLASVTVSPAVITITASVQAPSVAASANVSTTVITMTGTVQAPTVTTAASKWSNQSKNSSSWSNDQKS